MFLGLAFKLFLDIFLSFMYPIIFILKTENFSKKLRQTESWTRDPSREGLSLAQLFENSVGLPPRTRHFQRTALGRTRDLGKAVMGHLRTSCMPSIQCCSLETPGTLWNLEISCPTKFSREEPL